MKTVFVLKKDPFDNASKSLTADLQDYLGIKNVKRAKIANRYDIGNISETAYKDAVSLILSEVQIDNVYDTLPPLGADHSFGVRFLPAQYDQRADSAEACIALLMDNEKPDIVSSKVIFIKGDVTGDELAKIKSFCINSVDSCEIPVDEIPQSGVTIGTPTLPEQISGFTEFSLPEIHDMKNNWGLAMTSEDLAFCRDYFLGKENRNPTETEIRVIDTYWSDHCRHTTFMTEFGNVVIEDGPLADEIRSAYNDYLSMRNELYTNKTKPQCLMDIGTIGAKYLSRSGLLDDIDKSDEINACGIHIDVDIDGENEKYLLLFKNETHNHPTEIEPFGGAATCIGGAIRDPLSGRGYVFGAIRVVGSGDPTTPVKDTLAGKLPQRRISQEALKGFSSYGNQIGLATGKVKEFYHPGFVAKRMECGAVVGAVPMSQLRREEPLAGDIVVLVGGRTGKDGIGGATGSSKKHTGESLATTGSEVQKGNAVTERKLQRFMRNPEVSLMIKRCNDFGAGGVSVAIGELSPGLDIDLSAVPLKYKGLNPTEIAISESQERMAIVIENENLEKFLELAIEENLEACKVADITNTNRLRMYYNETAVVDISREFLDTNGVTQKTDILVKAPLSEGASVSSDNLESTLNTIFSKLANCPSRGISEQFDGTIGAGTVIHPLGGKYQLTENDALAMKIPLEHGETNTAAYMAYGYDPYLMSYSPFLGAQYSVIESLSALVSTGADWKKARLSFQEYFPQPREDASRWGLPFAAVLGALKAQKMLGTPAIGGKDSMSGSFDDLDVPPTLVSFAVSHGTASGAVSQDIKPVENSYVYLLKHTPLENGMPNYESLKTIWDFALELSAENKALTMSAVRSGGVIKALANMCFGNHMGAVLENSLNLAELSKENYGSIIIQSSTKLEISNGVNLVLVGKINDSFELSYKDETVSLGSVYKTGKKVLEDIFPTTVENSGNDPEIKLFDVGNKKYTTSILINHKPKVIIPTFPGSNCEVDTARRFEKAGAEPEIMVFKNITGNDIQSSIDELSKKIKKSQILAIPGGFSLGDEPDGSAKFITAVFRNAKIKEATETLLNINDGLILGICNGFQALIKLGLVPYGKIVQPDEQNPTLTFNTIGRHIARYANVKTVSNASPWLQFSKPGDNYSIPISHGEGRIVITEEEYKSLVENGQIASVYTDPDGNIGSGIAHNPNGSAYSIEGLLSPDGRVFGKMAHSERIGENIGKNIPGEHNQKIFESGVAYFK